MTMPKDPVKRKETLKRMREAQSKKKNGEMRLCGNPNCKNGENGAPKEFYVPKHKMEDGKGRFCCIECKREYFSSEAGRKEQSERLKHSEEEKLKYQVKVTCSNCGIEFMMPLCEYKRRGEHVFHNRDCWKEYAKIHLGPMKGKHGVVYTYRCNEILEDGSRCTNEKSGRPCDFKKKDGEKISSENYLCGEHSRKNKLKILKESGVKPYNFGMRTRWVTYQCNGVHEDGTRCKREKYDRIVYFEKRGITSENYMCPVHAIHSGSWGDGEGKRKIISKVTFRCNAILEDGTRCTKEYTARPSWWEKQKKTSDTYLCLQHALSTPEARENNSKALKKYYEEHPEALEEMSKRGKEYFKDEGSRERNRVAQIEAQNRPDVRLKKSIATKNYNSLHPEKIENQKKLLKELLKDPKHIKKIMDAVKNRSEENQSWRENILRAHTGDGIWYGNPIINNKESPRYCEKFKEVKPRVFAFNTWINNGVLKCDVCGEIIIINSKQWWNVCHHVFYVKETCCLNEQDQYWTNLNAPDCKEPNYCIGENPNYFATLCPSCHGGTNGKFENRKKWADYLKKFIDEERDGKSYFTEEEMIERGYVKVSKTKWVMKD